jgi:fatty acid desaturase
MNRQEANFCKACGEEIASPPRPRGSYLAIVGAIIGSVLLLGLSAWAVDEYRWDDEDGVVFAALFTFLLLVEGFVLFLAWGVVRQGRLASAPPPTFVSLAVVLFFLGHALLGYCTVFALVDQSSSAHWEERSRYDEREQYRLELETLRREVEGEKVRQAAYREILKSRGLADPFAQPALEPERR